MYKKDPESGVSFVSFLWLFYACCIFCLLLVFIWFKGITIFESEELTSKDLVKLRNYPELKAQQGNFECPAHLRFLLSESEGISHRKRKPLFSPEIDAQIVKEREQFAKDVADFAKNMNITKETLKTMPLSPIFRIQTMRQFPNQTFELKNMEDWEALQATKDKPSGLMVTHELGKHLSEAEHESLLGPELNAVLNAEIKSSVTAGNQSQGDSSGLKGKSKTDLCPLPPPSPDWPNETDKNLTVPSTDLSPSLDVTDGHNEPYDHEKGMEILRKFNQLAKNRLKSYLNEIQDYSCILYKWDQTNIKVDGMDILKIKMREKPFSIYAKALMPASSEGREFLYWEGHYNNQLVVCSGSKWHITLLTDLNSNMVKNRASRPLLQLGFQKLLEELIEISSDVKNFQDSEIRYYQRAKVGDRLCYVLEVTFPKETKEKEFYKIQVFVDVELLLPIQIIIYDWPRNGRPAAIREFYTYVIQKLNPGFKDQDFCHRFHEYSFKKHISDLSAEENEFMESLIPPTDGL